LTATYDADFCKRSSVQRYQQEAEKVQALASVLYDVRNDLSLGAALGQRQAEKNLLLNEFWSQTRRGDLLVMDRNFADYTVIAWAAKPNAKYWCAVRGNASEPSMSSGTLLKAKACAR
jgi:hypothetical protein